jgi:hypothetical protein
MKSIAHEQNELREGMKSYLSRNDKFSVRMSHAMSKAGRKGTNVSQK